MAIKKFFYSVDARERDFKQAERWSDETIFGNRAYFMSEKQPAELGVDHIREEDQAIYRCRVDFKSAQTRNSKINLTVIGRDGNEDVNHTYGTFEELLIGENSELIEWPDPVRGSSGVSCVVGGGCLTEGEGSPLNKCPLQQQITRLHRASPAVWPRFVYFPPLFVPVLLKLQVVS
ncbi:hypothetical protein J6590_057042 [Homalodisca vitripennis]|nr:hypothetical protein J6590_057042 [Homalodisca vitripennis]